MPKWKVGSLFAGVGGFDLGFEQTGKFETVWMSEWDKHAEGVLRRRFPGAKQIGDITKVDPAGLEPVDVVVGGFPCQDLSVAGKRAGLAGERSGLFHEFVRIVRGLPVRPSFIVVENVPGMLSSQQGRDFAVVLSEVAESWGAVSLAWRIVDSQYFGVAQRRRRCFLVVDTRAERAPEVLALEQGSGGDPPTRKPSQQEAPSDAARGAGGGGPFVCNELSPCLETTCNDYSRADGFQVVLEQTAFSPHGHYRYESSDQSATLQDRENRQAGHTHLIAQTFGKSARATSSTAPETWVQDEYANTLNGFDVGDTRATTVAVAHAFYSTGGTHGVNQEVECCPPLKVGSALGIPSPPAVAIQGNLIGRDAGGPHGVGASEEGVMYTLTRADVHGVAYPIQDCREIEKKQNGLGVGGNAEPSYTIDRTGSQGVAFPIDTRNAGRDPDKLDQMNRQGVGVEADGDPAHTLSVAHVNAVATRTVVRRLTPSECCILQGFPPDWNDGQADSHRYKQMGNAVTVTVAKWIAENMARLM